MFICSVWFSINTHCFPTQYYPTDRFSTDTNSVLYEVGAEYLYKMLMKVDLERLIDISLQTDLGGSLYFFFYS